MDPSRTDHLHNLDSIRDNSGMALPSATAASPADGNLGPGKLAEVSIQRPWTTAIARPRELIMEIRIGPAAVDVLVRTLASNFCRPSPNLYR